MTATISDYESDRLLAITSSASSYDFRESSSSPETGTRPLGRSQSSPMSAAEKAD